MNYRINDIIVPSKIVERNSLQRTRDFFYDLVVSSIDFVRELKKNGIYYYQEIKNSIKHTKLGNLERRIKS